MNIKAFFSDALGQALELGIGTADDVLRHVTPDVLSAYLPRPLWARLLTACLGAPRVDATLVVETIGVPNLCEHVPASILWQCISEIAQRSLGQAYVAPPPIVTRQTLSEMATSSSALASASGSMLAPPPDAIEAPIAQGTSPGKLGPSIPPVNEPLADLINELEQDERPITPTRGRTPTSQRFRQSNTGIGRLGATQQSAAGQRRPQAQASASIPSVTGRPRRTGTEVEDVEEPAREKEIAVDDSQLVDWQSTETTEARSDEDFSDLGRKR
ncbi:MAG: hypothetical protein ABI467_24840 [Kofleriaceae bacterium]